MFPPPSPTIRTDKNHLLESLRRCRRQSPRCRLRRLLRPGEEAFEVAAALRVFSGEARHSLRHALGGGGGGFAERGRVAPLAGRFLLLRGVTMS